MACHLLEEGFYHPRPAHYMYAFRLLPLEWLGIPWAYPHVQAVRRAEATPPPGDGAAFTLDYAASLAHPHCHTTSYPQQVGLGHLVPPGRICTSYMQQLCVYCFTCHAGLACAPVRVFSNIAWHTTLGMLGLSCNSSLCIDEPVSGITHH